MRQLVILILILISIVRMLLLLVFTGCVALRDDVVPAPGKAGNES